MNLIKLLSDLKSSIEQGKLFEADQLERAIKNVLVNTSNPSIKLVLTVLNENYTSAQAKAIEITTLISYLEQLWNPRAPIPAEYKSKVPGF